MIPSRFDVVLDLGVSRQSSDGFTVSEVVDLIWGEWEICTVEYTIHYLIYDALHLEAECRDFMGCEIPCQGSFD